MNIEGIMSKVMNNADKIAGLFGYYTVIHTASPHFSTTDVFIKPIQNMIDLRFPDLEKLKWRLLQSPYASPTFKNGIMVYILSEIADSMNLFSKYAKAGKKVGTGLAIGAVIASLGAGQSPEGEPHSGSSSSFGSGNIPNQSIGGNM